jgi:hypothetical protein
MSRLTVQSLQERKSCFPVEKPKGEQKEASKESRSRDPEQLLQRKTTLKTVTIHAVLRKKVLDKDQVAVANNLLLQSRS